MKKTFISFLLTANLSVVHSAENPTALATAIAGKQHSGDHKSHTLSTNPQQTLNFFDVQSHMTVVEIWPDDEGWYTEILAPLLRDKGKLYTAHFSGDAAASLEKKSLAGFVSKIQKHPKIYDKVAVTELQAPTSVEIAPAGSVDRILTFRNIHNWMKVGQAAEVFSAMFKALKPGGILGVVEHRNSNLKPQDPKAASGYVSEDYVIALARNAGFEFLQKSEINANSKDTKDYPEGVWALPPTLHLQDKDKQKYLAIGESDRMTIKFIKPQANLISLLTALR